MQETTFRVRNKLALEQSSDKIERRRITFALCPKCLWMATCFRKSARNCPRCSEKISLQKMTVEARVEETLP